MGGEIAVVAPIEIRLPDAAAAVRRGYVNDADQCGSVRMPMWVSEAFISTALAILVPKLECGHSSAPKVPMIR